MKKRDRLRGGLAACLAAAALALGLIAAAASGAPEPARAGGAAATTASSEAAERARAAEEGVIPGRYIVVYDEDRLDRGVNHETRRRERRLGFESRHRYRHAIEGFAAKLTPRQARALERDPEVASVSEDRRVSIAAEVPLATGEVAPTGVRRVLAATQSIDQSTAREASGVGVAVIDTQVFDHPDLVIPERVDCVQEEEAADPPSGHGTHVAGTIAARNQGVGVVGVAPGTTIYGVRVLNDAGTGTRSEVICGIDWVTANADGLNIKVANMSLGGLTDDPLGGCPEPRDPIHKAICDSTNAGVTYVVAAGNWGDGEQEEPWDFDHPEVPNIPAAYPEVLTVTAMADSDGAPGGTGVDPNCGTLDDSAAPFSNFAVTVEGIQHTIAAPGCRILSTYPGGWAWLSGTSMATPHVAGLVALCIDEAGVEGECAGMTPAEIIVQMRAEADAYNRAEHPGAGLGYGFLGDPLNPFEEDQEEYYGFLTVMPGTPPSDPDDSGDDSGSGGETGLGDGSDGSGGGDPGDPGDPADDSSGDDSTGPAGPASLPAALEVRVARVRGARQNRRLVVRGSLDRRAAGERLVVRFRSRGRAIRLRPAVRPNGRFAVNRRLRGRQRRARGGRVFVRFRGNETLRAAGHRLRAARRPVRLRLNGSAVEMKNGRLIVRGRVDRRARGRVRIAVEFNRPDGSPAEVTALARVRARGRFSRRVRVPPAARGGDAHVSIAHRGRGRLYGQRIGRTLGG